MLPTLLRFRKTLFCFASCCVLVALCLPLLSDTLNSGHRVPVAYDVFFEDTPTASISQVAAPQFSNVFTPLDKTPIPHSVKRAWIRISIPIEQIERWRMNGFFPFMQFGGLVRRPTTLFYRPANNPQRWQSSAITRGHIPLPDASKSGLAEYYLRVDGKPGIWFTPEITLKDIAMPTFITSLTFWLLVGLTLGIAGLNFFLAVFTKAESCFWLCIYTLLTTAYYTFGLLPSTAAGLEFSTAWTILLPGLALIILPHIGRNLFYSVECPRHIDIQLWGLSLLGLLVAVFPLIPSLSSSLHYLSLWPALAGLGAIPGYAAITRKIPGGRRFTAGCLLTALGSMLAVLPANSADVAGVLQLMPFAGVAMGLMILTPIALHGSRLQTQCVPKPLGSQPNFTPENLIQKISHDLQSPLVTIANMGEKLNDIDIPEEGEHALRTLQTATHVLQLQLKDLLDLNRADNHRLTLKKRSFDLQSLLKDAYHIMLPHTEEKGLTLTWKIAPNLPVHYVGDSSRLIQILINLLGNAVRFSDSGTISITVSSLDSSKDTAQLLVTVKDQGRGIPLQNKYDVLDRFCQEPEENSGKYCGSGLGLSITTELVHLMNGFLCIESEPNIGTTVSFTVRLEKFDKTSLNYSSAVAQIAPSQKSLTENDEVEIPQLLIIETRNAPTESIQELLDPDAFHAHEVTSFDAAITTYEAFTVDAVIVAAELTEDAINILSQLFEIDKKHDCPSAPAIAIANSPVSAELLCDSGYSESLPSPATSNELLTALAALGLYKLPLEPLESIDQNLEDDDYEFDDEFEDIDDIPTLEPLSLSGLDLTLEPEPEPEPINLLPENIVQEEVSPDIVTPIVLEPSVLSDNAEEPAEIEIKASTNELGEAKGQADPVDHNLEAIDPILLQEQISEELHGALPTDRSAKIQTSLTEDSIETSEAELPDLTTDKDAINQHDEYIFAEEPNKEHELNENSLPTPKLITPEEEAYLKEVLGGNDVATNTTEEEHTASEYRDEILLDEISDEAALDNAGQDEEKSSVTPPPLFSFDELDELNELHEIEDKEDLFSRVANERKTQAAQRVVTSDNHTAFSSIVETDEEPLKWDDTPLTEAVSHLTLNSEKAVHPAEVLDMFFLPQIPKIISQLQETFEEIFLHAEEGSITGILHTAEKLQNQAQKYALREVDKMASCVARAAEAEDQKAVSNLMGELEATVVQTGKALRDVYKHSSATIDDL